MTRQRLTIASGLVLNMILAATASAQSYSQPAEADTRMSGLRPGWSRESIDPASNRARYVVSPAPTQLVADTSSSSGRSFLPSWLSWRNEKPAQPTNNKPAQNNSRQTGKSNRPMAGGNTANRPTDEMQTTDSLPPDPAAMQEVDLPGLGGAPLPHKANQPTNNTAPPTIQRNPQKSLTTNSGTVPGAARSASREPLTPPMNNGLSTGSATARNSPGHRSAPHITPEELKRELSGSFPGPSTSNQAVPHTAQVDASVQPSVEATLPRAEASATDDNESVISDAPLTLPTTSSGGAAKNEFAPAIAKPAIVESRDATTSAKASPFQNEGAAYGAAQTAKSAYGANGAVHVPFKPSVAPAPQTVRGKEAFGEALQVASGGDPSVLASNQTPVLTADIRGPKQILVGREAVYRVRLQNQSDIPAEGIVATIRIPSGAEVVNTSATQGMVQPSQDGSTKGQLQWQLARLDRRANETMEIHLIPRESRPLELGVNWTLAPVGSRAIVEVQEAKLQLEIAGPNEVLFDKPQIFKLTISNPGTGTAENVKIDLMPPGGGQETVSHPLGDLAAGASQTIEVELTAREAGKMFVKAVANAEAGLNCDAAKEIFCRKPELEVDWRGPATKYAGTMATYFVRVRNPGTAAADDVTVRAALPEGAEFTSASEGQSYDTTQREVAWHVGTLSPGDDNYMEIKCVLKTPGANHLKIAAATNKGELTANKTAETNVIAIADLKLDVADPSGPVAVGSQAVYEIHIFNRGASAAKEINVTALFSEGIEPEQADGAAYTVADGRVSFRTIEELAAGHDITLKIRAHATQPGTHVFRAEVLCRDLEIKLAAEETTRFYADDSPTDSDQPQKQANYRSDAFGPGTK